MGQKSADPAHREDVAERGAAPAVHQRVAGDVALIPDDDPRLGARARARVQAATPPEAHTRSRVPTVPGLGQILRLGRCDDIHDMARCPRGPDGVSSGRLVTWAQAAAGQRWGPSGPHLGNGHLPWAVAAAAVWCLRHHPAGPPSVARVANPHGQGTALTLLAPQRARAVAARRTRHTAVARDTCRQGDRRRAGEPDASRATPGISLSHACSRSCGTAALNAQVRLGW